MTFVLQQINTMKDKITTFSLMLPTQLVIFKEVIKRVPL